MHLRLFWCLGKQANNILCWNKVQRESVRSGCKFKLEVPGLVAFVKQLSGGLANPIFLYEYRDFCRQVVQQKIIKGSVLQAVAEVKLGEEGAAPIFRIALVKAMASSTPKYSKGDEQGLFKTSDIMGLTSEKKAKLANDADKFLQAVRKVAKDAGIHPTDAQWVTLVGLTDVRVVRLVTNKADESRGIFKSLPEIGAEFVAALSKSLNKQLISPWTLPKSQPQQMQPKLQASGVKEFSVEGKWSNKSDILNQKGYKVGTSVTNSKYPQLMLTIVSFTDTNVTLKKPDGQVVLHSITEFVEGKFTISQMNMVPVWLPKAR